MKVKLLIAILFATLGTVVNANATKKDKTLQYEIASAGSGQQGTYLVKVFVFTKSAKATDGDLKRAAVHGVVFRGVPGGNGAPSQRPLVSNPAVEQEKAEYFEAFFNDNGMYTQFANIVAGSYERIKTPGGYKMGGVVQVNKDQLRKELEKSGIVRSLSNGF